MGKAKEQQTPLFPRLRPSDYFKPETWLVFYLGSIKGRMATECFARSLCIAAGPWGVRVKLPRPICCNEVPDELFASLNFPGVMREEDFRYLRDHRDFAQRWVAEGVPPGARFPAETFLDDLRLRSQVAR
jgi:hypothetical protein